MCGWDPGSVFGPRARPRGEVLFREEPYPPGLLRGSTEAGVSLSLPPEEEVLAAVYSSETSISQSLPPHTQASLSSFCSLTMGVLGSPSSCLGGHRKGSLELPAVLVLGKVQFLASWTGGGGPGSSQGSVQ